MIEATSFRHKHILSVNQFNRTDLDEIFRVADNCKAWFEGTDWGVSTDPSLKHSKTVEIPPAPYNYILASLFHEASTRTRFSFESAHQRLGGSTLSVEDMGATSSLAKGESLEDTIKAAAELSDIICLRHPDKDASNKAALVSKVPIINCGDGGNEHPTQALLDLYTIQKEMGRIDGLNILFFGDVRHARTIRSLRSLLTLYQVNCEFEICYHTPAEPNDRGWSEKLKDADVLYVTRPQRERWPEGAKFQMKNTTISFAELARMKKDAIVMHPGPRNGEMNPLADSDPRVAVWRQVRNGMWIRMALLKLLLNHT